MTQRAYKLRLRADRSIYQRCNMDPTVRFLIDVSGKLSPEGLQLLKTLYSDTLPLGKLARVDDPRVLYHLTVDGDASPSTRDVPVNEHKKLSPQDSLALFVHRLELLVPHSKKKDEEKRARELEIKDVGARACLDSLEQHGITRPSFTLVLSEESKMLECLVSCYVNMTPQRQRWPLKREMGAKVGRHPHQATVFEIFTALFTKWDESKNRCEGVVSVFVSCLQQAQSPRQSFIYLEQRLSASNVPHDPIPIPGKGIRIVHMQY